MVRVRSRRAVGAFGAATLLVGLAGLIGLLGVGQAIAAPNPMTTMGDAAGSTGSGAGGSAAASTAAAGGITLKAGISSVASGKVAVLEFLPERASVAVGDPVTWTFPSTEPHSVTFVPAGAPQPRFQTDPSLAAPTPTTGPVTTSTFVNSGLLPTPTSEGVPTFTLTFGAPGTYSYFCILHPNMVGTLDVGATTEPQRAVTARGYDEGIRYVREGRAAQRALLAEAPVRTRNADGTTTWTVEMGTSTEHTEVYSYAPSPTTVRTGDTVTFVNDSAAPHTSSFGGKLVPLDPEAPTVKAPVPGPGPLRLVPDTYLNTGWLPPGKVPGAAPLAARSFSFVAGEPGRYEYVCVLHVPSGMAGSIRVRD